MEKALEPGLLHYQSIINRFPSLCVLVLGDLILDCYIQGEVTRNSPEAPVPVVEATQILYAPGGAANVAKNIAHLGARVQLVGVVGDDVEGNRLQQVLAENEIDTRGVVLDRGRSTTFKTRIIAHNQQIVRVDRESREPVSQQVLERLLSHVSTVMAEADAVIISDYAKGVTVPELLSTIMCQAKTQGKPVIVDPKGCDYTKYTGARVITPNQYEAAQLISQNIEKNRILPYVAKMLLEKLKCQAILITQGEKGMTLFEQNNQVTYIPTITQEVYDVTGAGDTVVGVFTLALATGAVLRDCAQLANWAAGIVVGKLGTATVSLEELYAAIS